MKLLKLFGCGFIMGLATGIGFFIIYKALWLKESAYIVNGIGAFMGAAAVFVFTIILQWIGQFKERRLRDYNALIYAQYDLNMYLNIIEENKNLIENATSHYKRHEFFGLAFSFFPVEHKNLMNFRNLGLIEDYIRLNTSLRRHNQDYEISSKIYDDIHQALIAKVLNTSELHENYKGLNSRLDCLKIKLSTLEEEVYETLAKVQDLTSKNVPLMNFLHEADYPKNYKQELQPKIEALKKQIKNSE